MKVRPHSLLQRTWDGDIASAFSLPIPYSLLPPESFTPPYSTPQPKGSSRYHRLLLCCLVGTSSPSLAGSGKSIPWYSVFHYGKPAFTRVYSLKYPSSLGVGLAHISAALLCFSFFTSHSPWIWRQTSWEPFYPMWLGPGTEQKVLIEVHWVNGCSSVWVGLSLRAVIITKVMLDKF